MAVQVSPNLLTKEIADIFIRENFQALANYFSAQNQLLNFKFYELNITGVQAGNLAHGLGYTPKDIIVTQITGAGSMEFLFGKFNSTNIYYQTTGTCRVRFFVGTYFNDKSQVVAQAADAQTVP